MLVVSLNGTYVDALPIASAPLVNGDQIQMGKFRLVLLIRPDTDWHRGLSAIDESACLHRGTSGSGQRSRCDATTRRCWGTAG